MSTHHVLLIEEDSRQSEIYSDLIREVADCQIDVISRIESSLDWFHRFNYQLVVIDTSMPGIEPLSVLERIKRFSPETSVILLAEDGRIEEAVASIRLGAEDYLKKPFDPEAFQLAVKRGLDRKKVFGGDAGISSYMNLLSSCQMISATLEQKKIFRVIQSYFFRELRSNHSAIYDEAEGGPRRISDVPDDSNVTPVNDRAMEEVLDITVFATNPLAKMIENDEFFRFIDRGQLTPGLFVFRFKCAASSDFFFVCLSPVRPSEMELFESRLRLLRAQIEVTGKNIEHYIGVQNLVYVDDATGLYNTRYLNYVLDREIHQNQMSGKPFAVLFIDADRFKAVNDTHGHLAGTKLLNELGHQLKKYVRESDRVFRYGGDEFVAVLSPSDLLTAKQVAERIRQSIEALQFLQSEGIGIHITVSIGVALFPEHAKTKKAIIDAADHAMYNAKKLSRNCVFIASVTESFAEDRAESPRPGLTVAPLRGSSDSSSSSSSTGGQSGE